MRGRFPGLPLFLLEVVMWFIYVVCAVGIWFSIGSPHFWSKGGAF